MYRKVFGVYGTLSPLVEATIRHLLASQANRVVWLVPRKQPEVFQEEVKLGRLEIHTINARSDEGLAPILGQFVIDDTKFNGAVAFSRHDDRLKHLALILGFRLKAEARFVAVAEHTLTDETLDGIANTLVGKEIGRASCRERVCLYV